MGTRGQRGQTAAELLGVLALVGVLVTGIVYARPGEGVGNGLKRAMGMEDREDGRGGQARSRTLAPGSMGSWSSTPVRPAAAARSRAARSRRVPIGGRKTSTRRYRRGVYKRLYKGAPPERRVHRVPNLGGRRKGKLRISFFIANRWVRPAKSAPFEIKGDGRSFDSRFDAAGTRVTYEIDFRTDTMVTIINPTCARGPLVRDGCARPSRNRSDLTTRGDRRDLQISFSLKNSKLGRAIPGRINGKLLLEPTAGGRLRLSADMNRFPSVEAYYRGADGRVRQVCRSKQRGSTMLLRSKQERCSGATF